jgi:hypothetical protein
MALIKYSLNKEVKMKYCPNCGTEAKEMRYCSSCGANLQTGNPHSYQPQPKSQVIAFILCFFCGTLGIHRFYVGKIGTGILMLFMMPFVIFGSYLMDGVKMGQTLSETGDIIEFICAPLTLILVIWVLIDLIRILTGSFTKDYNSKYVNSGNGEPVRAKDKEVQVDAFWGEPIRTNDKEVQVDAFWAIITLLALAVVLCFVMVVCV